MNPRRIGLLQTHMAAFLFGGTALFSKWIGLPAAHITLGRAAIAVVALVLFQRVRRQPVRLMRRIDYAAQIGLGIVLGIHWTTYFASMQVSTVAIGMISLFTAPLLTVLIEPVLGKTRLHVQDVVLGFIALYGVYLLVPEFSWQNDYAAGVGLGLLSSVFLSLRNVLHRSAQRGYEGPHLMVYQCIGVVVSLTWCPLVAPVAVDLHDIGLIVLLGAVFTAVPHGLIAAALRHLPAKSVTLQASLMLVYGVALAWLLLGETPRGSTFAGGAIIAVCAMIEGRKG